MAKVKVVGRCRPFWDGKLRNIGEVVDVPSDQLEKPSSWMQPVRGRKPKQEEIPHTQEQGG